MVEVVQVESKHPRYYVKPQLLMHQAAVSFNSQCNADCMNCCGRITGEPYMPLAKAKEVLNVIIQGMRIKDIYPTCSAELTLYPHLLDLIRYADEIRIPDMRITQDTNGRFIPKGFIETLNDIEAYWTVSISLWGYDSESWQKYQGKGDWEQFEKNIRRYLTELKIAPSFSVAFIDEEQEQKTLEYITRVAKECGREVYYTEDGLSWDMRQMKLDGVVPILRRNYRVPNLATKGRSTVTNGTPDKKKDFIAGNGCIFLYSSFIMDSVGYIYPCLSVNGQRKYAIGNVFDYSPFTVKDLESIINAPAAIAWQHRNWSKGEWACDICETCATRVAF